MTKRIALLFILAITLVSLLPLSANADVSTIGPDIRLTGTVTELSYANGDFILRDKDSSYYVIANSATVQLNGGKFTNINDLKDRAFVRVLGPRLSSYTLFANTVIVLDDKNFVDLGLMSSNSHIGDNVVIEGKVTNVSIDLNRIVISTHSGSYIVDPGIFTLVCRYGYISSIYDIRVGDVIRVWGNFIGSSRLDAGRIDVIGLDISPNGYGPFYIVDPYEDLIYGVIMARSVYPGSVITIRTLYGMRQVRIPDNIDNYALSQIVANRMLCVRGYWNGTTMVARNVDVYIEKQRPDKKKDSSDKDKRVSNDTNKAKPLTENEIRKNRPIESKDNSTDKKDRG